MDNSTHDNDKFTEVLANVIADIFVLGLTGHDVYFQGTINHSVIAIQLQEFEKGKTPRERGSAGFDPQQDRYFQIDEVTGLTRRVRGFRTGGVSGLDDAVVIVTDLSPCCTKLETGQTAHPQKRVQ